MQGRTKPLPSEGSFITSFSITTLDNFFLIHLFSFLVLLPINDSDLSFLVFSFLPLFYLGDFICSHLGDHHSLNTSPSVLLIHLPPEQWCARAILKTDLKLKYLFQLLLLPLFPEVDLSKSWVIFSYLQGKT